MTKKQTANKRPDGTFAPGSDRGLVAPPLEFAEAIFTALQHAHAEADRQRRKAASRAHTERERERAAAQRKAA
jgi:hypothetical protein